MIKMIAFGVAIFLSVWVGYKIAYALVLKSTEKDIKLLRNTSYILSAAIVTIVAIVYFF